MVCRVVAQRRDDRRPPARLDETVVVQKDDDLPAGSKHTRIALSARIPDGRADDPAVRPQRLQGARIDRGLLSGVDDHQFNIRRHLLAEPAYASQNDFRPVGRGNDDRNTHGKMETASAFPSSFAPPRSARAATKPPHRAHLL